MTGRRGEWLPEQFEINKVIVPVIHGARIVLSRFRSAHFTRTYDERTDLALISPDRVALSPRGNVSQHST